MSTLPDTYITPEEYLEFERKADYKNEYLDGKIYAMSGVSRQHDWIESQLSFLIYQHLEGKDCHSYSSGMRVRIETRSVCTYPDLSVVCGQAQFTDPHVDTLTNPILLIEVLSPSTENYDRGLKAEIYREIPSLQELLLISQDRFKVELYRREPDGGWRLEEAKGLDASIELKSIAYTLRLSDLYKRLVQQA